MGQLNVFICGLHDPVRIQNGKKITDLRITNETVVGSSEHYPGNVRSQNSRSLIRDKKEPVTSCTNGTRCSFRQAAQHLGVCEEDNIVGNCTDRFA